MKIIRSYLPFIIGLVSGIYFINLTLTSIRLELFPGDYGDARFCTYLLEHFHLYITGNISSYWDAGFLYPEKNVISYSENLTGSAIFYSLPRFMGFDRDTSFQLWFILMSVLNYSCCYLFLNELVKNKYAAVCGAMIFAFSIALQSQMTHAQTFPRYAIPLTFWMGCLFLKELNPWYFFLMLFFFVYQFYCCIYLGFLLMVPLALFVLLSMPFKWKDYKLKFKEIKWNLWILGSIVANVLLLWLLMSRYFERSKQLGFYEYEQVLQTLPTLRSFFYSHYGSFFWEFLNMVGYKYEGFWDHQIFPGGVATLSFLIFSFFVVYYLVKKKAIGGMGIEKNMLLLFITGLITFILYMRFQGFSFYSVIYYLPGFGSMRSLQRIINVELIFYAIATAFIFSCVFRRENKYTFTVFVLCVGLILLDNFIKHDTTDRGERKIADARLEAVLFKVKDLPKGTIISYEPGFIEPPAIYYQLDAMLAAQQLGLKTLNGYTSNAPYGYSNYWNHPDEKSRLEWLKEKGMEGKEVIVIR